jgi:hypothetical protein
MDRMNHLCLRFSPTTGNLLYHLIPSMLALFGMTGFLRLLWKGVGLSSPQLLGRRETKVALAGGFVVMKDRLTGRYWADWNAIMSGWNPMM